MGWRPEGEQARGDSGSCCGGPGEGWGQLKVGDKGGSWVRLRGNLKVKSVIPVSGKRDYLSLKLVALKEEQPDIISFIM